jgi:uncharacterized repeat protein (TIGR01451 family)
LRFFQRGVDLRQKRITFAAILTQINHFQIHTKFNNMRKLTTTLCLQVLVLFLFVNDINGQQITDINLRKAILNSCNTCLDNNGNLLSEARNITSLSVIIDTSATIKTTKGLEGFTKLQTFYFQGFSFQVSSSRIHNLDSFPQSLKRLDLEGSFDFSNKLPDSLINLTVYYAENLTQLPALPKTLDLLRVSAFHNKKLTILPVLPPFIKTVIVEGFEKLQYIPNLPNSLTVFQLPNDSLFEQLPSPLPSRLTSLYLDGTKVKCLPFLPNTLTALYTSNVTCVPNLPPSVWDLAVKVGGVYLNPSQIPICSRNSSCIYPAYISGKVYYDSNNNGVQNANEPNTKQILIKSTDGSIMTLADTTGKYFLIGDYSKTYTYNPVFSNNYFKITPSSRTVFTTAATAQNFDSLDFAIQSLGTFPDIALSLTAGNARPGFNSISTLTYKNVGTTILNGTITLTLDAKQTFVSADVIPTQNGNVLTWNYVNLQPFDFKNINITLKTALTAPLSSLAISTVNGTITGASDANPLNNSETTQITVRGSYDPNDKQVDKVSVPTITAIVTTPLTYTIRFQNTGNAEAIRVEVVDTLTKKLDITTIEMLGASHPYEMKIVSDSGKVKDFTVVKWTFDGIYLPDSTSNEKGSHGFIKYRIKNDTKKMGLTVDSILNKAAIYFDFNKPIITNQARTLFNPRVATVELKDLGLNVFPNPVSNVLIINSTNKIEQELSIEVINLNGQVLMHQILRGQNPHINVQELSAGLYFLKIKTSEGTGIVKIIKQ